MEKVGVEEVRGVGGGRENMDVVGEGTLEGGILGLRVGSTAVCGEVDVGGGRVKADGPPHVTLYGTDVTTGTSVP